MLFPGTLWQFRCIESKKFPLSENLWLKGLSNDLNTAAGTVLEENWKREREADLGAYIYAILNANKKIIREVLKMAEGTLPFDELMEELGLTAKWEKRAKPEVKKRLGKGNRVIETGLRAGTA
jgi:hypothetical protein